MWGSSSILCFGDLFARGSTQLTLCHVAAIAAPLAAIFFHRLSLFAETYHASWKSFCFDRFFFQLWCLRTVLCTPFQALERLIISLSTRGGGCISHYGSRSCHSPCQVQQCIYAHSTTHLGAHSRKNSSEPMYHHHHGMVHGAMESDVCLLNTPSDTQWNAFQTPCALKAESEIEHHNQSAMRTAKLHRIQDPLSSVCCVEGTQVGTILAPSCELNRSRAVTQMYISRSPVSNSAPWIRRKILCIDFDRTITFLHTSGVQTSQFCTPERILRNINDLNMFTHFTLACLRQGHEVCITSFAGKETLGNKSKKNKSSSRFRPNRGSLEHGVKHLEPYSANPCDSESPHHDAQGRQNDSSSTEEFKNENISFRTRKHRAPEWEREPKPALSEQMICEPLYGEQLVLRYLDIIFGPHRDFLLPRHVECWHPRNVAELGKNGHIANLLHRSAFREEIALCDIILLDDDFHNVKRARDRGYCAFHCPEGITADWLQKTPHLTDILSLGK